MTPSTHKNTRTSGSPHRIHNAACLLVFFLSTKLKSFPSFHEAVNFVLCAFGWFCPETPPSARRFHCFMSLMCLQLCIRVLSWWFVVFFMRAWPWSSCARGDILSSPLIRCPADQMKQPFFLDSQSLAVFTRSTPVPVSRLSDTIEESVDLRRDVDFPFPPFLVCKCCFCLLGR